MESIHLEIGGRVQGVGFRWYVMDKARELGLKGWVRNRPDGKVEVAACGPASELALLESAIRDGPAGARVEHVSKLAPIAVDSLESPFAIAR
jgi:acylphosphatase